MRRDRFLNRAATPTDLTETIAESRATRISAGSFGIGGLAIVAAFVQAGLALAIDSTAAKTALGVAAALTGALAITTTALGLRPGCTPTGRGRTSERLVTLVLVIGLAAAAIAQGTHDAKCAYLSLWLPFGAGFAIVAAAIMPWTATQAGAVTLPAFALWVVALFTVPNSSQDNFSRVAVGIAGLVAAAVPIGLGFWNEQRFAEDEERAALSREVSHGREELGRARIVHDAMFRAPIEHGPVEVAYRYVPLREIGGDFVHMVRCPRTARVTTTVIDVSGHGLAAALTVNRLFGELERVVAEAKGDITPALVMTQLNRYIHLTMSAHSMFATAACVQVDPESRIVRWVVAGHPPPLLRQKSGTVERLDCTTLVLGAAAPDVFDPEEMTRTMNVGDTVIIYTDGTFEARNPAGQCFGLKRLEESVAFDPPPRDFPTFLANLVARHHEGKPDDDLLVAQVTFRGGVRNVMTGAA
ncbi:MAG: PP2C family protein-serine/threonine phosphatase [Phycisphaerae bacterium]|nr:PP2C family protein-serine/threonine phosphatase [Phycisphaerae bacterium]